MENFYAGMYADQMENHNRGFKISLVLYCSCLAMIRTAPKEEVEKVLLEMENIEDEKNTLSKARQGTIDACKFRLEWIEMEDRIRQSKI